MSGWRRSAVWCLAAAAAGGCAFGRKPFASDPLIRSQIAVWGDREKARDFPETAPPEPGPPAAPNLDLVGADGH